MRYILILLLTLLFWHYKSIAQTSVIISAGNTVVMNSDIDVFVDGDWENNGTLNATAGTIIFNGSSDQTITNPAGENFHNLTVSKTGGDLVLANNVTVKNTLTMESGNIAAGTDTLALGATSEGTLAHTDGTVIGSFSHYVETGIDWRIFPVGTATHYRPAAIKYTIAPTSPGTVTVTHDDSGSDAEIVPPLDDNGYSVDRHSGMYWNIVASGISGGTYDLGVDGNGQAGINNPSELRIVHSVDGSVFEFVGAHATGNTGNEARRNGISGNTFDRFYLGGNIDDNPFDLLLTFMKAIAADWNMVGLPYLPGNRHYQSVFPDSDDDTFFGFNGTYFNEDSFEVGGGYWLRFPEKDTVAVTGALIDDITLELELGWNMISGISQDIALEDVEDENSIIDLGTLFGFDGTYQPSDTIKQGEGYWIRTNNSGQVTISSSVTKNGALASNGLDRAGEPVNRGTEELNGAALLKEAGTPSSVGALNTAKLQEARALKLERFAAVKQIRESRIPTLNLKDSEGRSQALKFSVKAALDEERTDSDFRSPESIPYREHYKLPPMAPASATTFDARFAGDYHMSDADEAVIQIQSSNYPLTISAENLSAALTLEDAPDAQYVLQEIIGEEEGKSHPLVEGATITISDPQVKTLKLVKITTSIPVEFALHQNYPNPFNPTTTIKYDIPAKGKVDVQIYNALGQRVKTLVSKEHEAGFHEVVWDATNDFGINVGSGVYFYRINSGQYKAVKKMILLK